MSIVNLPKKYLLLLLLPVLTVSVLMSFYVFHCILPAQEEKVNTGVAVPGGGRTPAAAGGVRWLGGVARALSLALPPLPVFLKAAR